MLPLALLIGLLATAANSQARDYLTPAFGGTGGGQFVLRCPAGTLLTGLSSRQGAYINYIAPICAGREQPGAGSGGQQRDAVCPADTYIGNITIVSLRSPNRLLKAVALHCKDVRNGGELAAVALRSPGEYTDSFRFFYSPSPYPMNAATCGNGRGVGIHGRSGQAVDALGLICER
jgi:hypothetical protein